MVDHASATHTDPKNRRRLIRWLLPQVQGRVLLLLVMCGVSAVLLNVCLLVWILGRVASTLPTDGELLYAKMGELLVQSAVLTLVLAVPAFVFLGLAAMMPVVGPLHRFRLFLLAVVEGKHPDQLRLRDDDRFQDIAELLNRATALERARQVDSDVRDEAREAA